MSRPLLAASLLAALALAAIAPAASGQTRGAAADFAGRWASDNRNELYMEIRTEGARLAPIRRFRTDGTICTQGLSGTVAPGSRTVTLDQTTKCENGANGSAAAACTMSLTRADRMTLTCPDINPRTFRRTQR